MENKKRENQLLAERELREIHVKQKLRKESRFCFDSINVSYVNVCTVSNLHRT